jgi:hypothetical protein
VPAAPRWVQATKISGREQEPLVLEEIAADIAARMDRPAAIALWVLGPGQHHGGHCATHLGEEENAPWGRRLSTSVLWVAEDVTGEALLTL